MAETDKNTRILELHTMLTRGEALRKKELAQRFGVTEKSIQRDIEDLRDFFTRSGESRVLVYDGRERAYVLRTDSALALTNSEVLAVAKILLESRSMVKDEMFPILDKLVRCCTPKESLKQVQSLIANEKFHYAEPHHGKAFVEQLWTLGTAVEKHRIIEITYHRTHKNDTVTRRVQPVGILFSEYYFYLAAFIDGIDKEKYFDNPADKSPTIYRIDKIEKLKATAEHFSVPYKDRFQEGEMRKRIQFMYGGELQRIRFAYTGPSIEAVLDRLPTAKIEKQTDNGWIVTAEVFGKIVYRQCCKMPQYYVLIMSVVLLTFVCTPPAFAVDDIWTVGRSIITDVYQKIVGISTLLAGLMSAVAVLGCKFSGGRQQRVDQAWDWLKRIWIAWAVINGIGAFIAYIAPLFSGLATLEP